MKKSQLSHCERNFVNKCIANGKRLDGRAVLEPRNVQIYFGQELGRCIVTLGQTKVLSNVSCEIQTPKPSRPNEGMLHINVNPLPRYIPYYESHSEMIAFINTKLKKCFKDFKCVDMESLCIIANKKVWNIRVDLNVINHDGNLLDCASIATLAALAHFHRPDVTTDGIETVIHSAAEKDFIPLTMHHHPVCISFVSFEDGTAVLDPTLSEEKVAVAQLTMSLNSHEELSNLHCKYITHTHSSTVVDIVPMFQTHIIQHAKKLVKHVLKSVTSNLEARRNKTGQVTFKDCISTDKIAMMTEAIPIKLSWWNMDDKSKLIGKYSAIEEYVDQNNTMNSEIMDVEDGSAILIQSQVEKFAEGQKNTWHSSESVEDSSDAEIIEVMPTRKNVVEIELENDSEEEEVTNTISGENLL